VALAPVLSQLLGSLNNGGPATAFAYPFAIGFGSATGLLFVASLFNLLPSPLSP